jgi:NMT1/THI5 like
MHMIRRIVLVTFMQLATAAFFASLILHDPHVCRLRDGISVSINSDCAVARRLQSPSSAMADDCSVPFLNASSLAEADIFEQPIQLTYSDQEPGRAYKTIQRDGPLAEVRSFGDVAAAYSAGLPVRVIAGIGTSGLVLLGPPSIHTPADLRGKRIGTPRTYSLQLFAADAQKAAGAASNVQISYFPDAVSTVAAFQARSVDAIVHAPSLAAGLAIPSGAVAAITGETLWGTDYPDCVLVTTEAYLKTDRQSLKELIRALQHAKTRLDRVGSPIEPLKSSNSNLSLRARFCVDIRHHRKFIIDESALLVRDGYATRPANERLFDVTLLNEVLSEENLHGRATNE